MDKHNRLRIESWCKKLCHVTNNNEWKKNRNLHAISLLDMILNNRYEEPFNKFPTDGPLPLLSKTVIISKLSKRFWLFSQSILNSYLLKDEENSKNENINNTNYSKINSKVSNSKEINNVNNSKIGALSSKKIGKNQKNNYKQEIDELNNIIFQLQNELNRQDYIIQSQINEKNKLIKRIYDLEQVLKNFC